MHGVLVLFLPVLSGNLWGFENVCFVAVTSSGCDFSVDLLSLFIILMLTLGVFEPVVCCG